MWLTKHNSSRSGDVLKKKANFDLLNKRINANRHQPPTCKQSCFEQLHQLSCMWHHFVVSKLVVWVFWKNKSAHLNKIPFSDLELVWKADSDMHLAHTDVTVFTISFCTFPWTIQSGIMRLFSPVPKTKMFFLKMRWGGEGITHWGLTCPSVWALTSVFSSHNLFRITKAERSKSHWHLTSKCLKPQQLCRSRFRKRFWRED